MSPRDGDPPASSSRAEDDTRPTRPTKLEDSRTADDDTVVDSPTLEKNADSEKAAATGEPEEVAESAESSRDTVDEAKSGPEASAEAPFEQTLPEGTPAVADDAPDDDEPALSVDSETSAAPTPEPAPTSSASTPPVEPAVEGAPITFRVVGVTDVGLVREHNEDNYVIVDTEREVDTDVVGVHEGNHEVPGLGVAPDVPVDDDDIREPHAVAEPMEMEGKVGEVGFVFGVCDGMGGAAAGEVASQMAVDTVRDLMRSAGVPINRDDFARRLVETIEEAGVRIYGAAKMDRSRRGMGTTATIAGLVDSMLFVGEIGDSRCYVLRNGVLKQITKDQSLVNQLIEAGQLTEEEAEVFEHNNIILQALGTTEEVTVDLTFLELRRGDRVMLCSDGLSGLVHNEVIREIMSSADPLPEIAKRLVHMAHMGGGHDNITCVLAEFDGEGLAGATDAPAPGYLQYPLPPAAAGRRGVRSVSMKAGGRKPGADVKHGPIIQQHAGAPEIPTSQFPWPAVAMVLLALVLLLGYFLFVDDSLDPEPAPSTPTMVVPAEPEEPTAEPSSEATAEEVVDDSELDDSELDDTELDDTAGLESDVAPEEAAADDELEDEAPAETAAETAVETAPAPVAAEEPTMSTATMSTATTPATAAPTMTAPTSTTPMTAPSAPASE